MKRKGKKETENNKVEKEIALATKSCLVFQQNRSL